MRINMRAAEAKALAAELYQGASKAFLANDFMATRKMGEQPVFDLTNQGKGHTADSGTHDA